jgi:redox-sensitive bicupin YhaK (pirin superfamily)
MITVIPYEKLGRHDYGWLKAHYHFSFGEYYNPQRMGLGPLRVINDDIVQAGAGFPPHPHNNMEIITYVRQGAITHKDSLGNEGRTAAGDVQVMSAGTGIRHAEFNQEKEDTNLYQIWIEPREKGVAPRWDSAQFPKEPVTDGLKLLVSGRKADADKGALYIHADAAIYGGRLTAGSKITQPVNGNAYLLVSDGAVTVDAQTLKKGDGAEIRDMKSIALTASDQSAEILVIDVPISKI